LPIGYWGIEQACQDLSAWTSEYFKNLPLLVSVNLFRKQLIDPELPDLIQSILHKTNMSPQNLALEIRESLIVDDDPLILDAIRKLKSIDVKLIIDDFGAGYSSLRVLPTYPIDMIKISPTYIRNISRSTEDFEVVRFIVELAQRLEMDVIAQGIEFPHELIEVQSIKCNHGQGSYFCGPLDQDAVEDLFKKITQKRVVEQKIDPKKLI
jgi:EAL domain-containing protein (putative c-di-GMP-specific phosphodiesterase class I)